MLNFLRTHCWLTLLLFLGFCESTHAQLQAPEEFFPAYARQFMGHQRLVEYIHQLDEASDRIVLTPYGTSAEGRPLMLAVVSTPENLERLESIRLNHLRGLGMESGELASTQPFAIVWISCSVHGNEASGSETSAQLLYELASAKTGDALYRNLQNTIVIVDPSLNPDGYTRYTDHVARHSGLTPNASPSAWEHLEPWPGGRVNHYHFDLNRDWVWATQVETQQRLIQYQRWMPHIHADLHEMSYESSYYFAPAAEPYHALISPFQRSFHQEIGRRHAKAFDAKGWMYYTREVFDLLYPSYGDTYPMLNGSIGMTYEMAGGPRSALAIVRSDGDTLTLGDRIQRHLTASLSTIAAASESAQTLATEMRDYFKATPTLKGAYVFTIAENSSEAIEDLARMLSQHGIQFAVPVRESKVKLQRFGGVNAGREEERTIDGRDIVITLDQPKAKLIQTLLEGNTTVADCLTYDITAWSLPLTMGLQGGFTRQPLELRTVQMGIAFMEDPQAPAFGFALRPRHVADWRVLSPLLQAGLLVRYADAPVERAGQSYPAGTLYVLASAQKDPQLYREAFRKLTQLNLIAGALESGLADKGPDFGSDRMKVLRVPGVALLQDERVQPNAFGHTWYFFEQELKYPLHLLPKRLLSAKALEALDVLILTESYATLEDSELSLLEDWVQQGGRLIAMQGAAEKLPQDGLLGMKPKAPQSSIVLQSEAPDPMQSYDEAERRSISETVPGVLVLTEVDNSHPLAFGIDAPFYALRSSSGVWPFLEEGSNVIGVRQNPQIRGFAGYEAKKQLNESLVLSMRQVGRGSVVYAADDLAFRGFWKQGMHVLCNAVFYR